MKKKLTKRQRNRLARYYITCFMMMHRRDVKKILSWHEIIFAFLVISCAITLLYAGWGVWNH